MKTLYKMAVCLLVFMAVVGCAPLYGNGYGAYGGGYNYGGQGYGYQPNNYGYGYRPNYGYRGGYGHRGGSYYGGGYRSHQEVMRERYIQLGPYAYPGGEYDRYTCTQSGINCR